MKRFKSAWNFVFMFLMACLAINGMIDTYHDYGWTGVVITGLAAIAIVALALLWIEWSVKRIRS